MSVLLAMIPEVLSPSTHTVVNINPYFAIMHLVNCALLVWVVNSMLRFHRKVERANEKLVGEVTELKAHFIVISGNKSKLHNDASDVAKKVVDDARMLAQNVIDEAKNLAENVVKEAGELAQ